MKLHKSFKDSEWDEWCAEFYDAWRSRFVFDTNWHDYPPEEWRAREQAVLKLDFKALNHGRV